jgi:hypothetical protein
MKTIIENSTKQSKYIFADDVVLAFSQQNIVTPEFIIGDMNSTNATLVENVTPPEDWTGCKYFYDAGEWMLNPDWVDPTIVNETTQP